MQAAEALDLDLDETDTLGRDELEQVLLGHFMVDYWINLAVCHSLIVEDHPSLGKVYQVRLAAPPLAFDLLLPSLARPLLLCLKNYI